ncbi:MAG: HNH endonuclease [Desulfobacterales bacterium]|nr:HNH endonuclease [Desulfobacterales bacterium]
MEQIFSDKLNEIFNKAELIQGISGIKIKSGDLHKIVGDYPGKYHRMPICCKVMKNNMKDCDKILEEPLSGQGATLKILYELPR